MTCTADPVYIRAVSVKYKRGPSSTYSGYARESTCPASFEWSSSCKAQRPKTAVDVLPSSSFVGVKPLRREKTQLLEELMFYYGRNVHGSFTFPRQSHQERTQSHSHNTSKSLGYPWACQNEALRQMYKASERRPRLRFFTCSNFPPPTKTTST